MKLVHIGKGHVAVLLNSQPFAIRGLAGINIDNLIDSDPDVVAREVALMRKTTAYSDDEIKMLCCQLRAMDALLAVNEEQPPVIEERRFLVMPEERKQKVAQWKRERHTRGRR